MLIFLKRLKLFKNPIDYIIIGNTVAKGCLKSSLEYPVIGIGIIVAVIDALLLFVCFLSIALAAQFCSQA